MTPSLENFLSFPRWISPPAPNRQRVGGIYQEPTTGRVYKVMRRTTANKLIMGVTVALITFLGIMLASYLAGLGSSVPWKNVTIGALVGGLAVGAIVAWRLPSKYKSYSAVDLDRGDERQSARRQRGGLQMASVGRSRGARRSRAGVEAQLQAPLLDEG